MNSGLEWGVLALYLAGSILQAAYVMGRRERAYRVGLLLLRIGFGVHSLAILAAWRAWGVFPAVALGQSLSVAAWGLMGALLIYNLRSQVRVLPALVGPLCVAALMAAAWSAPPAVPPRALKSLWVTVHVICLMHGYGLLALTFLGSLLYLVQEARLRAGRLDGLSERLPSLARLDGLIAKTLVVGFGFMTLGMIAGMVYAQLTLGGYWQWSPKEVWALITWLLYAALLHVRLVSGWRGRRGAWLSVAAFATLLFTFLGAGLLFGGYHSFHSLTHWGGSLR